VQRGRLKPVQLQAYHPVGWKALSELERWRIAGAGPESSQHGHPLVAQPPGQVAEHLRGRLVEPLRVVDGDQHRTRLGEPAHQAEYGGTERALVRRGGAGVSAQQRYLDGVALDRR
jgi:hypothetical protein